MKADSVALSVIVPAYNEEVLLAGAIRNLRRSLDALSLAAEVIIVNDGSRDRTGAIADEVAREIGGVAVCHQANQGIGGAFRTGAARANGTYLILWPADMNATPDDLAPYTTQFGRAEVIVGVRRRRVGYNPLMRFNSWLYQRGVAWLFGLRLRDVNWIHAYQRDYFLRITLTQRGIPMLVEALVRLRDLGARIVEVEVEMKERLGGVSSASRPKVMWRTLTGIITFWRTWRSDARLRPTA